MLRVSINGEDPVEVDSVVMYDDNDTPVALCMQQAGAIMFCDAIRDRSEFVAGLTTLGLSDCLDKLPKKVSTLTGVL
jgi:hypothetical protein